VTTPRQSKAPEPEAAAFSAWGKGATSISYLITTTGVGAHRDGPLGMSAGWDQRGGGGGGVGLAGRFHGPRLGLPCTNRAPRRTTGVELMGFLCGLLCTPCLGLGCILYRPQKDSWLRHDDPLHCPDFRYIFICHLLSLFFDERYAFSRRLSFLFLAATPEPEEAV
jgi:hypothetical protein